MTQGTFSECIAPHAMYSIFSTKEIWHHWHNIALKGYRPSKQQLDILCHDGFHSQMLEERNSREDL